MRCLMCFVHKVWMVWQVLCRKWGRMLLNTCTRALLLLQRLNLRPVGVTHSLVVFLSWGKELQAWHRDVLLHFLLSEPTDDFLNVVETQSRGNTSENMTTDGTGLYLHMFPVCMKTYRTFLWMHELCIKSIGWPVHCKIRCFSSSCGRQCLEIKLAVAWDSWGSNSTAPSLSLFLFRLAFSVFIFLICCRSLRPVYNKDSWQDETVAGKVAPAPQLFKSPEASFKTQAHHLFRQSISS